MKYEQIRRQVLAAALEAARLGLIHGTSGNIAVRQPGGDVVAITPSGRPYDTMQPEDIAIVTLSGEWIDGPYRPSSETPMHTAVYRARPDVGATVHTHALYSTVMAMGLDELPPSTPPQAEFAPMRVVPFAVLTMRAFRRPITEKNREFRNEVEHTQGAVAEMLEMIPVARAHGLQEVEISKMNTYLNRIVNRGYSLDLINALFGAVNWVVFQAFQIICLAFTAYLACKGEISVGEVVLYQTYFGSLVSQISTLINIYPQISKGLESVKSIGDIMGETKVEQNNSIVPLGELKGGVEFVNVDFKYPDSEKWVLKDFSLKVEPGESIAFVGDSGAGKSTVLNLLIGFIPPVNGKILIDRINMVNLDLNEYRHQIAVVPQNTILFSGTIIDNIAYGLTGVTEADVWEVIRKVGLEDLVEKLPEGLHTQLGEHGDKLSGGQRQRISIARALIRKPKIIIFDEATSALDSVSEKKVQEATNEMMKNCTTFLVAHRLSTIQNADRIVVMKEGHIVEMGSYEELMEKKGYFYELKSLQS